MLKLNLGCGDYSLDGWVNIDLYNSQADLCCDARKLPYEGSSVDEIWASHLIEHLDFRQGLEALTEWYRVLRVGGKLSLETLDFIGLCGEFLRSGGDVRFFDAFFGYPWVEGSGHKFLYTESQLRGTLEVVGFRNIVGVKPDSVGVKSGWPESIFLKVEVFK